jgi:hypothetical protein
MDLRRKAGEILLRTVSGKHFDLCGVVVCMGGGL